MRVAVIGLGSIGRRHARCFHAAGASTVIGMDPTPDRQAQFLSEVPGVAVSNLDEALDAKPQIVVVASPNVFHAEQAIQVLRAGLAVVVEKPLCTNLADAHRLAQCVRETGGYLHMGSNWKFHPAFQAMKAHIVAGNIGQVASGYVLAGQWLPDWHPWEDYRRMYAARADLGGGAIFDTHEIDYLSWLLGPIDEIKGMTAHSGLLEIETEDVAACVLRFKSGALVSLVTDYIQRTSKRRYLLAGSQGTLEWDFHQGSVKLTRLDAGDVDEVSYKDFEVNQMYVAQARKVMSDVATKGLPTTGIEQALATLTIQEKWRAAGKSGQI
jgi:predicted dehydrogenase